MNGLGKFIRSVNWLMVTVYGLLMGGIMMVMLFLAVEDFIGPTMFFFALFGLSGAAAMPFYSMGYGRGWRWLAIANWGVERVCSTRSEVDTGAVSGGAARRVGGELLRAGVARKN